MSGLLSLAQHSTFFLRIYIAICLYSTSSWTSHSWGVFVNLSDNWEFSSVLEFSSSTGKDASAGTNHLWGPCELLAIKDEGGEVSIERSLGITCLSLELTGSGLGDWDGGDNGVHVGVDVSLVNSNGHVVVHDVSLGGGEVHVEDHDGFFEGLKSDKELSLDLDSVVVLVLGEDLVTGIELVALSVEVGSWEGTVGVLSGVLWLDILWVGEVVDGVVLSTLLLEVGGHSEGSN